MITKLYGHSRPSSLLFYGALFGLFFFLTGLFAPAFLSQVLNKVNQNLLTVFGTYYLWVGLITVIAAVAILFMPLRKQRLGDEKPAFSYFSWVALLYSTGMGSGLLLRAVQEPAYYLNNPPVATANNKVTALQYTFFHWGFTPWAMYSLFGLIVAYNLYVKKVPNLLDAIVPYTKSKMIKFIATLFIVLITITGVIASVGLGTAQVVNGIQYAFKVDFGTNFLLLMVVFIGIIATYSALTGINKVIKFLADFDFTFSILLMLFIGFFLNFNSFLYQTALAFYNYVIHFFEMSLSFGSFKTSEIFTQEWTVFYWAFWLAWVPFTGIFIARISKGRTIKEFLITTIFVPTIATVIWFSIFANSAFNIISMGDKTQFDTIFSSLFIFLEHFPFQYITFFIAGLLVLISIINSVDSAIFVLGMFSDNGNENPSKRHKLGWGFIITATALGLTAIGTNELLNGISNLLVIMALPFSFLYGSIIFLFFKNIIINKESSSQISKH
ncbi:glycine betaine transporter [Flavobacterium micromati]|uniref:Glycine betaine transporter n=1 Tax=Flavobacterium micromati TaxID=229205 RepID=A0A1M5HWB0_9FLAO|nr:BCCT family transporter [Flavobacterium micromati]SHG20238.1 glycine betaine transporter [Flavobacterium micromati]